MKTVLCEHLLYSELFIGNPSIVRVWLFLVLKADRDGHACIHRKVLPKLIGDISEGECEEALARLQERSFYHNGKNKILKMDGDCNYYLQEWNCRCFGYNRYINQADRELVLAIGICAFCGDTESLSVDHIKPVSRGGSNEISNLQCLCLTCNIKKGART